MKTQTNPHGFVDYLRLARSKNIGSQTFFRLINSYQNPSEALLRVNEFGKNITIISESEIKKELKLVEKFGAKIISFFDEEYPQILKEIADPPPVLTIKGDLSLLHKNAMAIVGARNASLNGINFAKKMARLLGENSMITVSGLARGIDTACHSASYEKGTIAVIAGGIDNIYPKENQKLYEILYEKGLIISENPFFAPPKPGNFIKRNRIISGLSLGVLVVEAGLRSGSLTTARFALEQGREVFATPGSPFDPRCNGTNHLIKEGAKLVENIDDILEEFDLRRQFQEKQENAAQRPDSMIKDDDIKKITVEIMEKLSFSPIFLEDLVKDLQISSKILNIALVQLELLDKIEVNLGKVNLKNNDKF